MLGGRASIFYPQDDYNATIIVQGLLMGFAPKKIFQIAWGLQINHQDTSVTSTLGVMEKSLPLTTIPEAMMMDKFMGYLNIGTGININA